jgi:O-antigen/teichoic acid export membrane protein
MTTSNNKIMGRLFDVGVGTFVNILLGLITTPLITRIADPSEYGQLAVFNAYADLFLAFLYLGLDRSLIRFFYDDDKIESKQNLLKICFLLPILTTIIVMIIFMLLVSFGVIDSKLSNIYLILLAAYCVVSVWNKISTILLKVTYKTKEYSFCTIIQKIVYCLVIVLYAVTIKREYFMMFVLASILSAIFAAAFATIYTKEYWKFTNVIESTKVKGILLFGLPFILYSCTDALFDSLDKLILEAYSSYYEIGIYSSAVSLVAIFLLVKTIFEVIWIPMQTEHFVNNPDDSTFIQKGSLYLTILLFFIGLNVMLFKDLICYILGSSYRQAAQIIPFLYLGSSFYAISDTTMCGIDISKKSYLHAIAGFGGCIINVVVNLILVPKIGAKGAAIATCASFIVYFVLRTYFSNKHYYIDYSLKRMFVMGIILSIYAYLNTFYEFSIVNVILYLIFMAIFIVLYFKDIKEMISYFIDAIKKMLVKNQD